jgi:hypothetical protein
MVPLVASAPVLIAEGDVPMFKRFAFATLVVAATILTGMAFAGR